jgi:hypothetical protein
LPENSRYPFFKEGMNPFQIHQDYRKKVLNLLMKERRPLNISNVSEMLDIAWITAQKILSELTLEGKLRTFRVGNSYCFEINLPGVTEMLSDPVVVRKMKEMTE